MLTSSVWPARASTVPLGDARGTRRREPVRVGEADAGEPDERRHEAIVQRELEHAHGREVAADGLDVVLEAELESVGAERPVGEAGDDGQRREDVERHDDQRPGLVRLVVRVGRAPGARRRT